MTKIIKKRKPNVHKKSRKEQRKDKRKEKKQRRHNYYVSKNAGGKFVRVNKNIEKETKQVTKTNVQQPNSTDLYNKTLKKEKDMHKKLKKDMQKQRKKQLLDANKSEDRNIKQLEKQLKINKRKNKSIPKSFASDGLDYLLELCEPENMQSVLAEQPFTDAKDDFEDDFALVTGKNVQKFKTKSQKNDEENSEDNRSMDESLDMEENIDGDSEMEENEEEASGMDELSEMEEMMDTHTLEHSDKDIASEEDEYSNQSESSENLEKSKKKPNKKQKEKSKAQNKKRKNCLNNEETSSENDDEEENASTCKKNIKVQKKVSNKKRKLDEGSVNDTSDFGEDEESEKEETWEDIYGRKRSKDGEVINENSRKYIPPALRVQNTISKERNEKLSRLRKQLKGLLNRLAESNMHSISSQIDEMYMSNSRNDMNETITHLIFEALISPVIAPERLVLEHVMLITILHANIGTEVGAHFLQSAVKKFNDIYHKDQPVENKQLDNVVNIISQLYNFKVFDSQLIYQILAKLTEKFQEKHVECILLILKNVGFSLRKDDPLALKQLILDLQKKALTVTDNNSRVKFMLDILLAIKNNNVSKIPNYDNTYSEHLKKLLKGFIRKGNYVTQLNISLDDLLKADVRGRWWVVGSAWTGKDDNQDKQEKDDNLATYNQELLELARKQRMNTDTRRNIFCILMTAEGYLDAFEKLLHLGLKNQQEREIIHVLLHCCLQEKEFNPYYGLLAQRFCEYDRKFQMTIRCSVWDKLKTLTECSRAQISVLAKLLIHLFLNHGLPISVLKVVQFSELDKVTLRFMRQILLGILLHDDPDTCATIFDKVATSPKLKMFRESLRLFIHHFLLRNLETSVLSEDQKQLLKDRAKTIEKLLTASESKTVF